MTSTGRRSASDTDAGPGTTAAAAGTNTGKRDDGGTRERIARDFVRLVEASPLDKVSIARLVGEAGINRKTFYYHFADKADLVAWIFRDDLARRLAQDFAPDRLVCPGPGPDERYPDLPHYVRGMGQPTQPADNKAAAPSLASSALAVMLAKRRYYLHVFRDREGTFERYLVGLYEPAVAKDIQALPDAETLAPATRRFLTSYAVKATIGVLEELVERPLDDEERNATLPFVDIVREGVLHAIEDHARPHALHLEP